MSRAPDTKLPDTPYWRAYQGRFKGILMWPDFDGLWQSLCDAPAGWYVFDPDGKAPADVLDAAGFLKVLDEARAMLDEVRNRSYCGAVYVDDRETPAFVKVFDPYQMGGACGGSAELVLPRWTFSKLAPDALPPAPQEEARRGVFGWLSR